MDPEPNFYGIAITLPSDLALKVLDVQATFKRLQEALWLFYDDPSNVEGHLAEAELILQEIADSGRQKPDQSEAAPNKKKARS